MPRKNPDGSPSEESIRADNAIPWASQIPNDSPVVGSSVKNALESLKTAIDAISRAMTYQGLWDCSGGSYPTPVVAGNFWICSVAGTIGGKTYAVTDWLAYNGTSWDKIDNTDLVTSVFGRTGPVIAAVGDYDASQIDNDSGISGATVKDALNNLSYAPGMVRFAATTGSDVTGNGTFAKPYRTVQKAFDEVALLAPTYENPGAVYLYPGEYPETVIVDEDNIAIIGVGGQFVTNVGVSAAPSFIVTNATRASVAAFLLAGGGTNPAANFGTLVAGANVPHTVQFRNINMTPVGGAAYRLICAGIGAGNSVAGNELNLMNCTALGKVFARGINYFSIQSGCWISGLIEIHNVAGIWVNDSQIAGFAGHYNVADDEPSDTGNYGLCGGKTLNVGDIALTGSARAGAGDPAGGLVLFQTTGNLDLDDTSDLTMTTSGIGGNIDAELDASFDLKGCHVQGGITIAAAGAGTAQMDGGRYMGALADPGLKLVRNLGN